MSGARPLAVGLSLLAWLTPRTLARAQTEYETRQGLSAMTAALAYLTYGLHTALTLLAAATTRWPLPVARSVGAALGLPLLFTGQALYLAGFRALPSLRAVSGLEAVRLITGGVHRRSRNPQLVGWGLSLAGVALLCRSGLALALAGLYWLACRRYLPVEEQFLLRAFGDEYRRYHAATPRYVRLPTPFPGNRWNRPRYTLLAPVYDRLAGFAAQRRCGISSGF